MFATRRYGRSKNAYPKPLTQEVETDQGAAEVEKGEMQVMEALVADGEPFEAAQPAESSLYDPTMAAVRVFHFDERPDGTGDSYLGTDPSYKIGWGTAPAFWRQGIRDFFVAKTERYLGEYNGDGFRFDSTRAMERARGQGNESREFMQYLTREAKQRFPRKHLIAEHLPDHESILRSAGFHAVWAKGQFDHILGAFNGSDSVGNIERRSATTSVLAADTPTHGTPARTSWGHRTSAVTTIC